MSVKEVLQLGDPRLRMVCAPVADPRSPEVQRVVGDLADTVAHWRETTGYGRAIAAPQIGEMLRVVVLRLPGKAPKAFVNPEVVARSDETMVVWDACLSFLSIFMQVRRHKEVTIRYQDLEGSWHELVAGSTDDLAELLQHELDHLDGILATDRIVDSKTICSRQEFEKRFKAQSPYAESKS